MKTACPHHTEEVHEWTDARGFLAEVRRRASGRDGLLLLSVPVVLVALHALPPGLRRAFALDLSDPTVLTAYTAHFLHFDRAHLLGNLAAYVLVVPTAYLLSVLSNRRRHFRLLFALVLGLCPFVISAAHLPSGSGALAMGFSGLVLSFYGYTSLLFVGYLATRLTTGVHLDHAPAVFFAQLAVISVVVAPPTRGVLAVAGLSTLFVGVYAVSVLRSVSGSGWALAREALDAGYLELFAAAAVLLAVLLLAGFSADRVGSNRVSRFAHLVGFTGGFLLSYVVLRLDCSVDHVRHCAGPDSHCSLHDSRLTRALRQVYLAVRRD